jgi:hypothetical protein
LLQVAAFTLPIALASRAADAQLASSDKALGEALFREGRTLLTAGHTAEACAKFAESERLDPQLGTQLNLALCHEREGKTASAWAEFGEVAEKATLPADKPRADFAREHARDLEKRLSRLRVSVAEPSAGVTVKVDGTALGASALGTAFPVDPGDHAIEAVAPGRKPYRQALQVASDGSTVSVAIPALEDAAVAVAAPSAPASTAPSSPSVAPVAPSDAGRTGGAVASGRDTRTLGIILAGAGAVGLGVGGYFGLQTFSQNSTANDHCPADRCDQTGVDAGKGAQTSATVSTIAFGVGLAGVAAGAYFFFTSRAAGAPAGRLRAAPMVGTSGGGLQVAADW